jgi:F-type H+-transporting ATPase subunit b
MTLYEALFTAQAWAASSTGAEEHGGSAMQLLFMVINFVLFVYILRRFLFPWIQAYLRSRREQIVAAIHEAEESKKSAAGTVQEYRDRLTQLEQEMNVIREDLRSEGEREKAKLIQEAEGLASRIQDDTRFLAEQEVKVARQRVRADMAGRAQSLAAELLQRHLGAADQNRLAEEFLRGVGQAR